MQGSAALLVAKQKTCNRRSLSLVNAVSAALISSASPIRSGRSLVPVVQQGAGIVNVAAAYSSYGTTTSTFLLLNDTRHFAKSQKISRERKKCCQNIKYLIRFRIAVFNTNKKTTIYTVKHIPASSILTFNNASEFLLMCSNGLTFSRRAIRLTSLSTPVDQQVSTSGQPASNSNQARRQPSWSIFSSLRV